MKKVISFVKVPSEDTQRELKKIQDRVENLYEKYCKEVQLQYEIVNLKKTPREKKNDCNEFLSDVDMLKHRFDLQIQEFIKGSKTSLFLQEYVDYMKKIEIYFCEKEKMPEMQTTAEKDLILQSKLDTPMIFTSLFVDLDEKILKVPLPKMDVMVDSLVTSEIPISEYTLGTESLLLQPAIDQKMDELNMSAHDRMQYYADCLYEWVVENDCFEDPVKATLKDLTALQNETGMLFPPVLISTQMVHSAVMQFLIETRDTFFDVFFDETDWKCADKILELKRLDTISRDQYLGMVQIYDKTVNDIVICIKDILVITDEFLNHHEYLSQLNSEELQIYFEKVCHERVCSIQDVFKRKLDHKKR